MDETTVGRDIRGRGTNADTAEADPAANPTTANAGADAKNRADSLQGDGEPESMMPLFSANDSQALRSRWESLQVSFVDEPKRSVEEADRLVSDAINRLSSGFATEREHLEQQWHRGESVSTEDLRLAFRRYRSFFERLLSICRAANKRYC